MSGCPGLCFVQRPGGIAVVGDCVSVCVSASRGAAVFYESKLLCWHLLGSGVATGDELFCYTAHAMSAFTVAQVYELLRAYPGTHDFCELFGGQGGVLKVGIRRRLRTGRNFDLTTGVDLSQKTDLQSLVS